MVSKRGIFGRLLEGTLRHTHNSGCRRILLQTAVLSAVALLLLVCIHCNMTNLTTGSVESGYDFSVDNNAAADSGSQRYHDDISAAFCRTLPHLAECRHVCIISCLHLQSGQISKFFFYIYNTPADVHAAVYHTVIFYRSRHTDTDSLHIVPGNSLFRQLSINRLRHIRQNRCSAVILVRLDLPFVNEPSIRLKKSDLAGRSPYVNSKCIFFHASILLFPICILASFPVRYVLCRCLYPCL